ncbi:CAMK/CAMK-unique protein kinase [Mycena kentingensis (nom. inval.)]|nr:CAMK/CAMK-unique protein kinase [Mycena kentingensis (nom. inval.)]
MHHDAAAFRRFFSSPAFPPDGLPTILTPSHPLDIPAKTPTPDAQLGTSPAALFLSAFSPVTSKPKPLGPVDEDGSVVGGFVLGPVFAHGAFSTIRRATSSGTGAVVAVKVVPRSPSASISQRRRLANEEAVWTSLSHEHILPLFAAIHTPTTDFFITQLCPAGSLFDIMRGGTPGRDDAGRMFRQIVRGLRYLHCEKRLVHRDIKLENVLVDEAGVCRIADFGMARGMDEDEPELGSDDDDSSGPAIPLPLPLALPVHKSTHHGPGVHRAVSLAVPRGSASTIRRDRTASVPASAATPPSTTETEFQPGSLPYAAPELLGAPKDKAKTTLTASLSLKGRVHGYAAGERDPGAGKSSSAFLARTATISSASSSSSSIASSASSSTTNTMDAPIPITTPTRPHPAQDIWALGVLLYALLVGTLPFADAFEPRLVLKILGGTYPPPPPSTPRGTLAVLRGCLTSRVADRWTVERVDEHAWAVGGEDVPLSPPDDVLALADDADSALEDCEYDPADDGVMRKKPKQKVPAPLDLGMEMDRAQRPLERGRPSAAMRRAEREREPGAVYNGSAADREERFTAKSGKQPGEDAPAEYEHSVGRGAEHESQERQSQREPDGQRQRQLVDEPESNADECKQEQESGAAPDAGGCVVAVVGDGDRAGVGAAGALDQDGGVCEGGEEAGEGSAEERACGDAHGGDDDVAGGRWGCLNGRTRRSRRRRAEIQKLYVLRSFTTGLCSTLLGFCFSLDLLERSTFNGDVSVVRVLIVTKK